MGAGRTDGPGRSCRPAGDATGDRCFAQQCPGDRAGIASGVFNTSRQVGGALAVAVFGALLANQATFLHGLRTSLLLAAAVAIAAAALSLLLKPLRSIHELAADAAVAAADNAAWQEAAAR
jgi:hypothetical protein